MDKHINELFNVEKIIDEYKFITIEDIDKKLRIIQKWNNNKYIKSKGEIQIKGEFFLDIFTEVLDYKTIGSGEEEWNLCIEEKTEIDGTKPDGIIGFYSGKNGINKTYGVIELKGFDTNLDEKQRKNRIDYGTPVDQAFSYSSKYDGCKWIIVSNLNEFRLYKVGRSQNYYQRFYLEDIQDEIGFKKFYLSLCKSNLIEKDDESYIDKISKKNYEIEKRITKEFYKEYKDIRMKLIKNIKSNNKDINIDQSIRCAQKFLDRIIFICFCEGMHLIKQDALKDAIERGRNSYNGIWLEIKGLFRSLDEGREKFNIKKFNGELFKFDNILDNCIISDEFFDELNKITKYSFPYEINVEILGYIFEQSIVDLEEIRKIFKEIDNYDYIGRRKKEGIYYTPEKITKFIIESTLGNYLEKKFDKILNFYNENNIPLFRDKDGKVLSKDKRKELIIYEEYLKELKNVKILDASCGSGAFLVQAYDFLRKEYERVIRNICRLRKDFSYNFFIINEEILINNLYGVDINEESINITKLSLWLKTVEKERPLLALSNNIRCGNSLISDKNITSKAFNWYEEFPDIIENGGFDVIVGNPPYLSWKDIEERTVFEKGKYLNFKYKCRKNHKDHQPNLYIFFIILCVNLLKDKGILGLITSQEWLNYEKLASIRNELLLKGSVKNIIFDSKYSLFVDFDEKSIGTNSSIIIYEKGIFEKNISINIPFNEENKFIDSKTCSSKYYEIKKNDKWNKYGFDNEKEDILFKINNYTSISLNDNNYFDVFGGFQPPKDKIDLFTLNHEEYLLVPEKEKRLIYKVIINASSIDKYVINDENKYWIIANEVIDEKILKSEYPFIYDLLCKRIKIKEKAWYKFPNIRNWNKFKEAKNKILVPRTKDYNAFALDQDKYLFKGTNTAIYIKKGFDVKYVLGYLNSSLLTFWYKFNGDSYHGSNRKYEPHSVKKIRIPIVDNNIENNISNKVNIIQNSFKDLNNLSYEFSNWINTNFDIKIKDEFYELDKDKFIKKYFKNISPKKLNLINKYFDEYKIRFLNLKEKISLYLKDIDEIFYSIYNINQKEKDIIKRYLIDNNI